MYITLNCYRSLKFWFEKARVRFRPFDWFSTLQRLRLIARDNVVKLESRLGWYRVCWRGLDGISDALWFGVCAWPHQKSSHSFVHTMTDLLGKPREDCWGSHNFLTDAICFTPALNCFRAFSLTFLRWEWIKNQKYALEAAHFVWLPLFHLELTGFWMICLDRKLCTASDIFEMIPAYRQFCCSSHRNDLSFHNDYRGIRDEKNIDYMVSGNVRYWSIPIACECLYQQHVRRCKGEACLVTFFRRRWPTLMDVPVRLGLLQTCTKLLCRPLNDCPCPIQNAVVQCCNFPQSVSVPVLYIYKMLWSCQIAEEANLHLQSFIFQGDYERWIGAECNRQSSAIWRRK